MSPSSTRSSGAWNEAASELALTLAAARGTRSAPCTRSCPSRRPSNGHRSCAPTSTAGGTQVGSPRPRPFSRLTIVAGFIPECRANTKAGYVQGGGDGMPILGDFAAKYGAVAGELGVNADDLYQALVDTAENTVRCPCRRRWSC